MKCPKCQRENTLKRAENNAVVCAACGSRFLRVKNPPSPSNNDSKNATRSDGAAQSSTSSAPSPQAPPVRNFDAPPFAPPAFDVPPQVAPFVDVSETPSKPKKRKPNPFSWRGRASQVEFFLKAIAAYFGLGAFSSVIAPATPNNIDAVSPFSALGIFISIAGFFFILLFFAATPRRFRDAGLSPYWSALFLLVPALGLIGGADFGPCLAPLTYAALVLFLAYYPSKLDDVENEENDVSGAVPTQAPAQPNANQSPSVKYCVKCGTPLPTPIQEDAAQVNDVSTHAQVLLAFVILLVILGFGMLFADQELGLPLLFIAMILLIVDIALFACVVNSQNARQDDDEEEEEEEETP